MADTGEGGTCPAGPEVAPLLLPENVTSVATGGSRGALGAIWVTFRHEEHGLARCLPWATARPPGWSPETTPLPSGNTSSAHGGELGARRTP